MIFCGNKTTPDLPGLALRARCLAMPSSNKLIKNIHRQSLAKLVELVDGLDPATRLEDSVALYQAWLKFNAQSPLAYAAFFNLGCALGQTGALEASLQAYHSALKLQPNFPHALVNSGFVLERLERPDEALVTWQSVVELPQLEPQILQLAQSNLERLLATLLGREESPLDKAGETPSADKEDWAARQSKPDTDLPLLSVIIATHERPQLLARAVGSVKAQSAGRIQTIVVADSWDPATYAAIAPLLDSGDLFLQRNGTPGPAASRNLGLDVAKAEHVLFLDDDDSFSAGFVDALLPYLQGRADAVLYCRQPCFIEEERHPDRIVKLTEQTIDLGNITTADTEVRNRIPNNCQIFPRRLIAQRRFDEHLILFEDWEFLINVLTEAELRPLPITGPITHKNDRQLGERRGARNDHLLADTLLTIYARWPGGSPQTQAARRAYLLDGGVDPSRIDELLTPSRSR